MLERLRQCVAQYGWQCLASEWLGVNSRHPFACARGHVFERVALTLLYRNGGAPVCISCQQEDIRDRWLAKLAERGGTLLNGPFIGLFARYQIRCAAGHEWSVEGRKISEGRWCPSCAHGDATRRSCCSEGWPGFTRKHKREMGNVFRLTIRSRVVYIDSNVQRGIVGKRGQTISSGNLVWSLRKIDLLRASRSQWLGTSAGGRPGKGRRLFGRCLCRFSRKIPFSLRGGTRMGGNSESDLARTLVSAMYGPQIASDN